MHHPSFIFEHTCTLQKWCLKLSTVVQKGICLHEFLLVTDCVIEHKEKCLEIGPGLLSCAFLLISPDPDVKSNGTALWEG